MRILRTSLLAATAIMAALPSVAGAQDVVMRRPIPMSMVVEGGASWKTTPWVIFDPSGNAINVKDACGDYTERRDVYCGKPDGSKVEELYCRAQEKPIASRPARHDEGCTYSWSTSDWRDPGASCSLKEPQSRDVKCLRDTDKVAMAESFCSGAKPDTDRTVEDFATCTYTWRNGDFVDPGSSCTNTEKQDRKVWCERDLDRTVATSEALCDPTSRPAASQSVRDISACTYSWKAGQFVDPGDSCTRAETQTRDVTCHRSLNVELADDAACKASDKPTTTQTVEDYKTCSFKAVEPGDWSWSSTCSATAVKTRTYKCQRSNDGGEIVDSAMCDKAGVSLTESVTEPNYSTCSHSWSYGAWGDPGASCTAKEDQYRAAWCKRDLDNQQVDDALCDVSKREPMGRQVEDYSACAPYWYSASDWSGWSSYCSTSASRTREIGCFRYETACTPGSANYWSDAGGGNCYRRIDDAQCRAFPTSTRAGFSPASASETAALYSSCTNSWSQSGFVDPGPNCGNETWTQSVTCTRDLDRQVMGDAACTTAKPASTDVRYDVSSCGYARVNPGAWTPSSTCSATATKTRTYQCQRSDGQIVDGAECTNRGTSLTETVGEANYSTCSNSWRETGFVDPGNSCGNETWTQGVTCRRDLDQALMADGACSGAKPSTTSVRYDVSGCGYTAVNWTGWTYASTCSSNTSRTDIAQCRRGDGQIVDNSECSSRNVTVFRREDGQSNYSTCSYNWAYSAFVDPGASCTANEIQNRTAWCKRDLDNAVVGDASCAGKPQQALSTNAGADYSGCGYAAVNPGDWVWNSTCSATAVRTRTYQCRRGDGTIVAGAECTNRGVGITESVQEANYSTCSNSWDYGAFTDPGASCGNETWTRTARCRRDLDNATMADGACGSRQPLTDVRYDVSGCGYSAVNWSAWSWNSTCSGSATRTQTAQCRRGDGAIVDNSECTNRGVSLTSSVTEANYSGCTYSGGSSQSSCTNGQATQYNSCRRNQTGEMVSTDFCGIPSSQPVGCSSYSWQTGGWGGFGACQPGNVQYQYRDVWCQQNNAGNISRVDGSLCTNAGLGGAPTNVNGQACSYYTYAWTYAGPTGWNNTCSSSAQRTQQYYCRREQDGASVDGSLCAGGNPSYVETQAVYSSCSYTTNWTGYSACPAGANQTQSRSIASCIRNQTGESVDLAYCGGQRSESQACVINPGGYAANTTLGTYAFATCSQQYDYGTQGTMPGVNPAQCRTGVATYAQQCTSGGNFATNANCTGKPWVSNPRGPTGYPCDIVCR
jgi:hypothetical protein